MINAKVQDIRQKTYKEVLSNLKEHKRCMVIRPTGFGKTWLLADVTRALRHDGLSVGGDIVCEAFIGDNATETVKYLTSKHIITTSGNIASGDTSEDVTETKKYTVKRSET